MNLKKPIVIKIKKEDLPKRRAPIIKTKKHKTDVQYNRNPKHKKKDLE